MDLAEKIYLETANFPKDEKYGLMAQLRRCAVSVPSNISEGAGRSTNKQLKYFIEVAMGSCNEVHTQLELSYRLKYINLEVRDRLSQESFEIYKMLLSFYNSLKDD